MNKFFFKYVNIVKLIVSFYFVFYVSINKLYAILFFVVKVEDRKKNLIYSTKKFFLGFNSLN